SAILSATGKPSDPIDSRRGSPASLLFRTGTQVEYASIPAQVQTGLRSPWTLSMRPTAGQNLCSLSQGAGNAACAREYGRFQSSAAIVSAVCGAFFNGLFCLSMRPVSIALISPWMAIIASQNRSSSAFDSLSVGSTIIVPATGQLNVGA